MIFQKPWWISLSYKTISILIQLVVQVIKRRFGSKKYTNREVLLKAGTIIITIKLLYLLQDIDA